MPTVKYRYNDEPVDPPPETMLYKYPGTDATLLEGKFDHIVVEDTEVEDKLAEGWHLTAQKAKVAYIETKADKVEELQKAADNAAPTRAELEQKATELGLVFDGRSTDKRLAVMIADAIAAKKG